MTHAIATRPTAAAFDETFTSDPWMVGYPFLTPTYVLDVAVALAVCGEPGFSGAESAEQEPRSWNRMLQIGEASACAGERPAARRAYLIAFERAREMGSVPGILQAAAGLTVLGGEGSAVESMVRVAQRLAARGTTVRSAS